MEKNDFECELDAKILSPKMSKVIMLNDDYTEMSFVVNLLVEVFSKGLVEANDLMFKIHTEGKAVCGIYPYDIAQTKANIARRSAKQSGYPLRVIVEEY